MLTKEEKEKVQGAIEDLEKQSGGELVIYIAKDSDTYIQTCWKWAVFFGVGTLTAISFMSMSWHNPHALTDMEEAIATIAMMLIGFVLPYFIHSFRLKGVPGSIVAQRIMTKAHDIFLQKELFQTQDRIGILFYISRLEHQVVVLGDKGINAKIVQEDWEHVVAAIIQGIKQQNLKEGLINAISECQDILLKNGFHAKEGQQNELKDEIIIEE